MKELARALVHDVGKQIARVARNVEDEVPSALRPMLRADLYALRGAHGSERASARFARLVDAARHPTLDAVRALLSRLDALEPAVVADDAKAIVEAVRTARRAEALLRAFLHEVDDDAEDPRD